MSKYEKGEEFYEISLDLPKGMGTVEEIAASVLEKFKGAYNVKVIPCKIVPDFTKRLIVSRHNQSYIVYSSKQKSQIIDENGGD